MKVKCGNVEDTTSSTGYFSLPGKVVDAGKIYLYFSTKQSTHKSVKYPVNVISEGESNTLGPEEEQIIVVMQSNN